MVWVVNRSKSAGYSLGDDVFIQKTTMFLSIHKTEYNAFDLYFYWRVGVNVFNIDMTVHDVEYLNNVAETIKRARVYNTMGHYRPIGIAVTVSAVNHIDIGETIHEKVDIVILKDVTKKEHIMHFRKKSQKFAAKPILVWINNYGLHDLKIIIKISDGVILDFYKPNKVLQPICSVLIQYCQEVHKPVMLFRPALINSYLHPQHELLPVLSPVCELNMDGILMEDDIDKDITAKIYSICCAMYFTEKLKENKLGVKEIFFQRRSVLKLPVTPPLSVALGASLTAIYTDAKVIMVLTKTGKSARWASCAAPPCPVIAITTHPATARLLHIYSRVIPLLYDQLSSTDDKVECLKRITFARDFCFNKGMLKFGDRYIVLMPDGDDGYCNRMVISPVPW